MNVTDPYSGREQTKAKHFILRHYLQALAFKVLSFSNLTYVDGFSGPWEAKTDDYSDTSFMIALSVLRNAQERVRELKGVHRKIRCFFSETNPEAFAQLQAAVATFHRPEQGFEIKTYFGEFENSVPEIQTFIADSFALIFIDPTGWTGYPLDKIRPLFMRRECEVLINFMYEFVNRFASSDDERTIASLNPILGGPGWRARLDPELPRGVGVEKLFRETLRSAGSFAFVVSTRIDKATVDRPHFFITYGTKSRAGLKAFRESEYAALREHARSRVAARERRREEWSSTTDLFSGYHAETQEATIEEIIAEQKSVASAELLRTISLSGPRPFSEVVVLLLEPYMLRETNVKDICVDLAKAGKIENTWGAGTRKPRDQDLIRVM